MHGGVAWCDAFSVSNLSIKEGSELVGLEKVEGGDWWRGYHMPSPGEAPGSPKLFPCNYVQEETQSS